MVQLIKKITFNAKIVEDLLYIFDYGKLLLLQDPLFFQAVSFISH